MQKEWAMPPSPPYEYVTVKKHACMETITCIDDLCEAARSKVPRAFFDFVEGGS
jgi:hypothetical protein